MSSQGHDVIVVGAGPAGLAAACRATSCEASPRATRWSEESLTRR
jgi:succinate dehydrogenase/fumarate reductase flavoprotein subunit